MRGTAAHFAADDGEDVTLLDVPLKLVNVNRPPVLSVPDTNRAFLVLDSVPATSETRSPATSSMTNRSVPLSRARKIGSVVAALSAISAALARVPMVSVLP